MRLKTIMMKTLNLSHKLDLIITEKKERTNYYKSKMLYLAKDIKVGLSFK
jgi:hypothetical protein